MRQAPEEDNESQRLVPQDSQKGDLWYQVAGYIWALVTVFGIVSGTCCAQALGGIIPPFELNVWRYTVQSLLTGLALLKECNFLQIIPERSEVLWIGLGSLLNGAWNLFFYTATVYLPTGTVAGLEGSFVLMIVAAVVFLRRKTCLPCTVIAVLLCVAGVVLLIQPDFIFGGSSSPALYQPICGKEIANKTNISQIEETKGLDINITETSSMSIPPSKWTRERKGYILSACGAVTLAAFYILTAEKFNNDSPLKLSVWLGLLGVGTALVLSLCVETMGVPRRSVCWTLLFGHAFGAALATIGTVLSLQLISPVAFSLIQCLSVPLLFVAQYTFMKDISHGKQNAIEIVGAVLVILGNAAQPGYQLFKQRCKMIDSIT